MSNVEVTPAVLDCPAGGSGGEVEILTARDVPLGGPRAMTVRRTLPQRTRSLIGAWCFADHFGPDDVSVRGGMDVGPHPHTGLQTVTWLFAGEVEHRDSLGTHALVRPGELNLMTSGRGICHSEVSTPNTATLHGVQLWVALPDAHRHVGRDFRHYAPPPIDLEGGAARVFLGALAGERSPVPTYTSLLGAEIVLEPSAAITLPVEPGHQHGVLVDTGVIDFAGTELSRGDLGYLPTGAARLALTNPTDRPARVVLLGGEPFEEDILMWWNFVGRTHDEILAYRAAWAEESEQFGRVEGYEGTPPRLPAPAAPTVRLKPRNR
jgi:hypothetical protein